MVSLRINLFGVVRFRNKDTSVRIRPGPTIKALMGYLALFRDRLHARETLAGLFWGESCEKKARSCLNTTLCRLRKIIEPASVPKGTYLVTTPSGEIGFNRESDFWLDIDHFEKRTDRILSKPAELIKPDAAQNLENALNLYRGDLMEGYYHDWVVVERERLKLLYQKGLNQLLKYHRRQGNYGKAITCARKILNMDPLREDIHREMMRLHCADGCQALAVRQYVNCCSILADELGVPPMEETQVLYEKIYRSQACRSDKPQVIKGKYPDEQLNQLIRTLHSNLDKSTRLLKHSAWLMQQIYPDRFDRKDN